MLAFTQAGLDVPVYMKLPAGTDLAGNGKDSSKYLLKLKKSLHGLKNACLNWHNKLKETFEGRGFVGLLSDSCVFISKDIIILVYVDDFILISKFDINIQKFIDSMKDTLEGFEFTEEGTMNAYLGVDISPFPDGKGFTLSQPLLIYRIILSLGCDQKTTKVATNNNLSGYPLLNKDEKCPARKSSCKYRRIIGMLVYLQGTTRPDVTMATHQCARFNNDTHLSY